jgi:hypothetical protein
MEADSDRECREKRDLDRRGQHIDRRPVALAAVLDREPGDARADKEGDEKRPHEGGHFPDSRGERTAEGRRMTGRMAHDLTTGRKRDDVHIAGDPGERDRKPGLQDERVRPVDEHGSDR